jgi:ABC-type phosphate transport system substrate-binding protein
MLRLIGLLVMLSATGVRADDAAFRAAQAPFCVVVHRNNPMGSITRAELSAIYMKRKRSWRDGREIVPVDQPAASRVRQRFSRAIHGKHVAYVTRYWQRLIFSGRGIPPRQLQNDAAVLELVRNNRDAIGYIARTTAPGEGVKVIAVTP